jgi:hypothetical protein
MIILFYCIKVEHEIESYNFFTKVWDPPSTTLEVQKQSAESSGIFLKKLFFIRLLFMINSIIVNTFKDLNNI